MEIRKGLLFFAVFMLIFGLVQVGATEQKINIVVNNKVVVIDEGEQQPVILNDRTYVPLRVVSENLGAAVDWDADNQQVLIRTTFNTHTPPLNPAKNLRIVIDGQVLEIPEGYGQAFISAKGRTMIPLRVVAEALDCKVDWVQNVVIIQKEERPRIEVASKFNRDDLLSLTIMGEPIFTREQLKTFLAVEEERIRRSMEQGGRQFIPFPNVVDLFYDIGKEYGIRGDIALFQSLKETGYFQFTGDVRSFQNNYAGIWATGVPLTGQEPHNGTDPRKVFFLPNHHGATFINPQVGVEAQIQHLYAYATNQPLPLDKELFSPRFIYVQRGVAPTWVDLTGRWATDPTYGVSILRDYVGRALDYFNMY